MAVVQLELDLWAQLSEARDYPLDVNWSQLCIAFDEAIARTPASERLAIAGDAIEELAGVLAARVEGWWQDWSHSAVDGPVLEDDLLGMFVRQSMSLELEILVCEPELYVRTEGDRPFEDEGSVAEYRDKDEILAELESMIDEPSESEIAALEYDEDVEAWIKAIALWLEGRSSGMRLVELLEGVDLAIVPLWLGLLLGGFELRQAGGFYEVRGVEVAMTCLNV